MPTKPVIALPTLIALVVLAVFCARCFAPRVKEDSSRALTAAVPPTHPNGNTNSANDSGGTKRVLLHTINDIQSHYAMMKQLAMTLLEIGGFEVYMLVGHYLNYEEETEMSKDIIQFTYRTKPPGTEKAEGSDLFDEASDQYTEFMVSKYCAEFNDISKALVDKLRRIRFHVAIYDTWNLGVLPVLRIIGARATVAVSVTAPQAVFLYYLGTPLPDTVPALMHAKLGDGKGVSVERRGQIVHETQAAIYEEVEVHKRVDRNIKSRCSIKHSQSLCKGVESLEALFRQSSYFLVNTVKGMDFVRPLVPKIELIGGAGIPRPIHALNDPASPVPHDHTIIRLGSIDAITPGRYTDETTDLIDNMVTNFRSVVIVSLGLAHRLSGLPPKTLEAIFSVLIWFVKQQPNMDVVVHVDPDADGVQKMLRTSYHKQPQEIKRRILLRPSIQQQKLMATGKIRALVSNCGQNSLLEAVWYGVPIVCIPLADDQFYNAAVVEQKQLGLVLDIKKVAARTGFIRRHRRARVLSDALSAILLTRPNRYYSNMQTLFFALRVRSYPGDVFASFVKIAALNAPRSLTLTTGGGGVCGKNGGGGGGPVCNIRGLESMHFIWFSSNFYSEIKIN